MMKHKISINTSRDQNFPEFEINHPHNRGVINHFLRKWRHYEGLQKFQEDSYYVKFYTIEDLLNSHD